MGVFDLLSDIFLAVEMSAITQDKSIFSILFMLYLYTIIFPVLLALLQLMRQLKKHWWKDDNVKVWLASNVQLLYFLSIFTGASFTAIELVNSNLFQLEVFSMDLTREQLIRFRAKSVYSIVFMEVM